MTIDDVIEDWLLARLPRHFQDLIERRISQLNACGIITKLANNTKQNTCVFPVAKTCSCRDNRGIFNHYKSDPSFAQAYSRVSCLSPSHRPVVIQIRGGVWQHSCKTEASKLPCYGRRLPLQLFPFRCKGCRTIHSMYTIFLSPLGFREWLPRWCMVLMRRCTKLEWPSWRESERREPSWSEQAGHYSQTLLPLQEVVSDSALGAKQRQGGGREGSLLRGALADVRWL